MPLAGVRDVEQEEACPDTDHAENKEHKTANRENEDEVYKGESIATS